tara:strand:- start:315 stop:638 length:324 start_codon:yes stop_codon:yes gene_type:complete
LKNFFIISLLFIFCVLIAKFQDFYIHSNEAEVIISLDNFNSNKTLHSIKNDFSQLSGVEFLDASLMTNSVVLKVKNNNIDINVFEDLFNKWGCSISDINYRILSIKQ